MGVTSDWTPGQLVVSTRVILNVSVCVFILSSVALCRVNVSPFSSVHLNQTFALCIISAKLLQRPLQKETRHDSRVMDIS